MTGPTSRVDPHPHGSHIGYRGSRYGNLAGSGQRVRIIARKALRDFGERYPDAKQPLDAWYHILKGRAYRSPHEVRADFPTASFLGARRTVFNIGGNKYRLVVDMRYDLGRVYVRDVLTHEEYDAKSIEGVL